MSFCLRCSLAGFVAASFVLVLVVGVVAANVWQGL